MTESEENFPGAPKSRKCNFGAEDDRHYDTREEALAALEAKNAESKAAPSTESVSAESSIVHHDKQVWTDPHPVEETYITDFAEQHPDEVDETILPKKTKEVFVKIGKLHAIFWMLIVVSGIIWSFMLAAYLFTGFGSQAVSLMGVLGTLVLAITVFMLSKDNVAVHIVEIDPDESK
jgi:hypothetical protein